MTIFSKKYFQNQEVLIADGSIVDVRSLRLGSIGAQEGLLRFLTQLQDQLCSLINSKAPESRFVVIQGLNCYGPPVFAVDCARGTDEVICFRHRLREILSELKLNQVKSLFIGKGHLCSPITELVQSCLVRVWRPSRDLFFSSAGSFCDHLFYFSDHEASEKPEMLWIKSLKSAQNSGFIDAMVDEIKGNNEYLISNFVLAGSRPTLDHSGKYHSILDQVGQIRKSEAKTAFGNAKRFGPNQFKDELEAKAYREVSYVRDCLNRSSNFGKSLRPNDSEPIVKFKTPEKFGVAIDLSGEILDPLVLQRLAKRTGIVILTAGSLGELEKRNSDLRSRFSQKFGAAAAMAFWEKNIVAAIASKDASTPLSILKPTGAGSFQLTRPDGMVVKIISNSSATISTQNALTNQIFQIAVSPIASDWVDLVESWPEFNATLRALDSFYVSAEKTYLDHLKYLFYYLVVIYGFQNDWSSKNMTESVQALGLDSDCIKECIDNYFRGQAKNRRNSFGRQSTESGALIEEFIGHFAITFAGLVADDEETKGIILWMLCREDAGLSEELQPTVPMVRAINLKNEGSRTLLCFKWFDSDDSEVTTRPQSFQLYSQSVRIQEISGRISDFIMRMQEEDLRFIERAIGIQLSDCLPS